MKKERPYGQVLLVMLLLSLLLLVLINLFMWVGDQQRETSKHIEDELSSNAQLYKVTPGDTWWDLADRCGDRYNKQQVVAVLIEHNGGNALKSGSVVEVCGEEIDNG